MPVRPMLDDIELQNVQKIEVDGDQVLVQHGVPALEGDFLQRLGRRGMQITITGVLTGPEAGDGLKNLRDKFRAAEPVSFVADIAAATRVDQVLIEEMGVRELAGKPERFEYTFTLREYIPPVPLEEEPPEIETPENQDERIDQGVGILIVEVNVEGQSSFDFSRITTTVRGTQEDGTDLSRTLTNRTDNIWKEDNFPMGNYTVEAITTASAALTGSAPTHARPGETTRIQITLRSGAVIAKTFVIHFRFDKAFIEPCLRSVLEQVITYAAAHKDEKLVIVGHTDKVGPDVYNQSLSERRSRSAYAYLTFGGDRNATLAEWNALRRHRTPGVSTAIEDSWEAHQYQFMLQELEYYPGNVDGDHGPLTDDAVRAYRCHKGLPPGTQVDDLMWEALIEDYLATRTALNVTSHHFLPNAGPGCDGGTLKWLGCGEKDPVKNTRLPLRLNRRTEFLFVRTNALPCEVPRPATLDLPPLPPPATPRPWCLNQGNARQRCCFVTPAKDAGCPSGPPTDSTASTKWCRQAADPVMINILGRVQFLGFQPNSRVRFKYILIAPDGEYVDGEVSSGARKGEGQGKVVSGRTDGDGNFSHNFTYAGKPKGFYTLEITGPYSNDIRGPFLIRLDEQGYRDAKGNSVCKALHADTDRLNVTVLTAPVLREIRLPVVAHLMTPLNLSTRDVRNCPDLSDPTKQLSQATTHTEAEIQAFFEGANRIWRQARIRFELKPANIVRKAYAHPIEDPNVRGSCEVDHNEFSFLLGKCAYPDAVNVFFFGDLAGLGEAGFGVSPEGGAVLGVAGCAVGDRFQGTVLGIPHNISMSEQQTVQVLAHELGHYLNLDHATDTPPNADCLMLPSTTFAGTNRTLTQDEVNLARTSQGATDDCVPLSLTVTGAMQVGGSLSNQFIVVQNPGGTVTVEAQIPDRLLDPQVGTLTITDGSTTVSGRQFTVSKSSTGDTEIVATYTPTGGAQPVMRCVVIRVVTFNLRVEGAIQDNGPGSTNYVAAYDPTGVITIVAQINPAPYCVPTNLVTWDSGDTTPDPLRRTVAKKVTTTVTATLSGTSVNVTIRIIDDTMILHPALGFPGLAESGGELEVLFLARDEIWTRLGAVPWHLAPWEDPQQIETVEVLEGPRKIESSSIQKSEEGWMLTDHHLKMNKHLMTLYERPGFTHIMWVKLKAPPEPGMYRLVNHFDEGEVLREAIKGIHELEAFEDDFPDDMPLIPDRGTTTVTTREGRPSNMSVELYHPVYVSDKAYLDIAHVADTHVALRWELYDRRAQENNVPLYNNFNRRFEEIMRDCRDKADIVLLTGDIIDYNRGHSNPLVDSNDLDADYQFNRNWLLAYELILNSYSQANTKPIFSVLGNHDYNLNAYAPSPYVYLLDPIPIVGPLVHSFLYFTVYDSSHDFNMLRQEMEEIDPGDAHELDVIGNDSFTHTTPASVLWYSLVINPFLDYAFSYREMAFLCLDWGHGTSLRPPNEAPYTIDPGILPYPTNSISNHQWSLIQAWHQTVQSKKAKVLAFHATVYQPFPEIGFEDLSKGRIYDQQTTDDPQPGYHPTRVHYSRWTHGELVYGAIVTARHRRELIDFSRSNLINLVLYGHSHRNTIFQIRRHNQEERVFMYRPDDMAKLDLTRSLFVSTISSGPLGFKNDNGVAEHLDGLQERRKIKSGFRIISFSDSGEITSLDTFGARTSVVRPDVQREFQH